MSNHVATFELRVRTNGGQPREYYSRYGKRVYKQVIKMFHVERRTRRQAVEVGKKYGEVVSCRKVDAYSILIGNPEQYDLTPQTSAYGLDNQYNSALAMDEMIWKKRNNRRKNKVKDKKGIDN